MKTSVSEVAEGTVLPETQDKRLDEQKLKDLKGKNYLFQALTCHFEDYSSKKNPDQNGYEIL